MQHHFQSIDMGLTASLEARADQNQPTANSRLATIIDQDKREAISTLAIPDHTQQHIQDIPHIASLYTAYHNAYADPTATNKTRMLYAKEFAYLFLKHYYPESQNYMIEPAFLGPIAVCGIGVELKSSDEPDSDIDTAPSKPKHSKKNGPAAKHRLEPANLAAYVVKQRVETTNGQGDAKDNYRPLLYLGIIIDDLSTFPRWSRESTVHRADMLIYPLGMTAKIERSPVTLLCGPRMEFYDFDAIEITTNFTPVQSANWKLDMRISSLWDVDEAFKRAVLGRRVRYTSGDVSVAGKKSGAGVSGGDGDEIDDEEEDPIKHKWKAAKVALTEEMADALLKQQSAKAWRRTPWLR